MMRKTNYHQSKILLRLYELYQYFFEFQNTSLPMSSEDVQRAISQFIMTFPQFKGMKQQITIANLSSGIMFIGILQQIPDLHISSGSLNKNAKTWVDKLSNLKRIVQDIEEYFEKAFSKGLKTSDLNLIQIAKDNSTAQMLKLFQVIMSVLLESPEKDEYIQKIMGLDEKSQSIFVSIIQNAMESRLISLNQVQAKKMVVLMDQLSIENSLLRQEIQNLYGVNFELQKQNKDLKLKIQEIMEQLATNSENIEMYNEKSKQQSAIQNSHEKQQLKIMVANLKEKLMKTAVQHQMQLSKFKEELAQSQNRAHHANQLEQALELYKQRYEQTSIKLKKFENLQKEKNVLQKKNQQKQNTIKKLNQQKSEMELNQLSLKMQLVKKETRYRQMQQQVKNRFSAMSNQPGISGGGISADLSGFEQALKALDDSALCPMTSKEKQTQIQQTRLIELEKQNRILMKKAENLEAAEKNKQKMQKAIDQLQKRRRQQMHVLLMTLLDYKQENQKLNEQVAQKKKVK